MALWTSGWTSPESGASRGFAAHALKTGSRDCLRQAQAADNGAMNTPSSPAPKVLAFDVFGTVVDWHGGIAREVQALRPAVDGHAFALAWRAGYQPAMRRVMSGELGWTLIDDLHRLILGGLVAPFGREDLGEAELRHLN